MIFYVFRSKEPLRPRSFLADWPIFGPIPGGMLRPVSNPDAIKNVRSFWPDVKSKLGRNQNWFRFLLYPQPGTEPDLLPSVLVPSPGTRDDSSSRCKKRWRGATTEGRGAVRGGAGRLWGGALPLPRPSRR